MQAAKKYIKFIDLTQLFNWSVQGLLDAKFNYSKNFELAKIGDFLVKSRHVVIVEDKQTYKRVKVRINNNGVVLRDSERGVNIGTKKQYRVGAGQFIVSKIDARNGAFGIIPDELDGAIVTNDFPLFNVNTKKILPQFLLLVTTTKHFIKFAQSCSSGTTNRQRMDIDLFLKQRIPLPSIKEQEKIIKQYESRLKRYIEYSNLVASYQSEIKKYFKQALGVKALNNIIKSNGATLRIIEFSDLEKWGLDFLQKNILGKSIYNQSEIALLCKISSGGTPSRGRKEYYENGNIPWIKTGELSDKVILDTEEKITNEGLQNSSAKIYRAGSIAIAMYGATIGKTAKLGVDAATNQACAVLFDIKNDLVLTDYLWEFLQNETENLKKLSYGSAQPNLNAGIIANYKVPLPPLSKQKEIVSELHKMKSKIEELKIAASKERATAITEFEKTIFDQYEN